MSHASDEANAQTQTCIRSHHVRQSRPEDFHHVPGDSSKNCEAQTRTNQNVDKQLAWKRFLRVSSLLGGLAVFFQSLAFDTSPRLSTTVTWTMFNFVISKDCAAYRLFSGVLRLSWHRTLVCFALLLLVLATGHALLSVCASLAAFKTAYLFACLPVA